MPPIGCSVSNKTSCGVPDETGKPQWEGAHKYQAEFRKRDSVFCFYKSAYFFVDVGKKRDLFA